MLVVAAAGCSGAGSDATPTTTDPPEITDTPGSALVGGEADAEVPPSDSVADGGDFAREGVDGPAVSARFTAVSVGEGHSCGLRDDATIVCWGDETSGQVDAPGGRFSGVVAGPDFSCGIRADGTRECWGRTGLLLVPDWPFANVDAGPRHWCGLRSDGTLACWGDNSHGQADSPDGRFTTVTAGGNHSCALRSDGALACWGDNGLVSSSSHVPEGRFTTIAIAPRYSCGLRIDRTISCWRLDHYGQTGYPEGEFQAVAVSETIACALDTNGGIVCSWDRELLEGEGPLTLGEIQPWGRFTSLVVGATHACALGADGNIFCWEPVMRDIGIADHPARISIADYGQADAPRGQYTAVAIGKWHSCGLRVGQTVTCWGDNAAGQTDTPDGQFSSIAAGGHSSCGLRADGRIECWGAIARFDPSLGLFAAVSLGDRHACALRVDRTVACWGDNTNGQTDAPDGEFTTITAAGTRSCGLRTDGTIACWGHVDWRVPPAGVRLLDHPVAAPLPDATPETTIVQPPPPPSPGPGAVYVIQAGDTIYSIASDLDVTVDELIRTNNLTNPDVIRMGDELCIP